MMKQISAILLRWFWEMGWTPLFPRDGLSLDYRIYHDVHESASRARVRLEKLTLTLSKKGKLG
jgi:hypothetical protein